MRPLVSLVMMVKDEAASIRRTLESVRHIIDGWTILDTGSTDGTQEVVREVLQGIPGRLYEEPFVDYAASRNRALELSASSDGPLFTLMLSADETVENPKALAQFLEEMKDAPEGAYAIAMVNGSQQWPYTRVLRVDAGWRYEGVIHERPVAPDGVTVDATLIPGVRIVFSESNLERKRKRLREHDLPLLTKIVEDESRPKHDRVRAMYYLADTHAMIAGDYPKTGGEYDQRSGWLTHNMIAMSLYWRYALIAEDERNTAADRELAMRGYFLYYHIADKIGFYAPQELFGRLKVLCEAAPRLAEAHFMLADVASRIDVRQGLLHAIEAAKVAREVRMNPPPRAIVDTRTEWLCYVVAAQCAKMTKSDAQARDLARKGVEAGGPKEAFAGLL